MPLGGGYGVVGFVEDVQSGTMHAVREILEVVHPVPIHFVYLPLFGIHEAPGCQGIVVDEVPLIISVVLEHLEPLGYSLLNAEQSEILNRSFVFYFASGNTYTGLYPKRSRRVSTIMAGTMWKRQKQTRWWSRDVFMDPPGYQATPFRGILVLMTSLPISMISDQVSLYSDELVRLQILLVLKKK